jgi:4a-hydroxytetrahydrobiopterin dehydratase
MVGHELRERAERDLPGWRVRHESLHGRWAFPDFAAALAAAVHVGALAEQTDHHPDIRLSWGCLEIDLTTHSAKRLTDKDLELAGRISSALGQPEFEEA